jgi:hypothetical protein
MAWVSDAAKIADGGSGDFSSRAACSAAVAAALRVFRASEPGRGFSAGVGRCFGG